MLSRREINKHPSVARRTQDFELKRERSERSVKRRNSGARSSVFFSFSFFFFRLVRFACACPPFFLRFLFPPHAPAIPRARRDVFSLPIDGDERRTCVQSEGGRAGFREQRREKKNREKNERVIQRQKKKKKKKSTCFTTTTKEQLFSTSLLSFSSLSSSSFTPHPSATALRHLSSPNPLPPSPHWSRLRTTLLTLSLFRST